MRSFISVILCIICNINIYPTHAQNIVSTIAGTGMMGELGDGGPATAAQLYLPDRQAVDRTGNVYTAGTTLLVRKIDTAGIITAYAGNGTYGASGDGGPATAAQLYGIRGIATDTHGNLFIATSPGQTIRKVNEAGIISTIAGTGIAGYSGDGGPATAAQLNAPEDITVDGKSNIFIEDGFNYRIRKIDSAGIISTIAGTGLAASTGDGGPATDAAVQAGGLAVDYAGDNLYFLDSHKIRKIDLHTGIITTIAGTGASGDSGDGGPATNATFITANKIVADGSGYIYISSGAGSNRIRVIRPDGIIMPFAGIGNFGTDDGPALSATMYYPCTPARYGAGPMYFGDRQNNLIRKITMPNSKPYFSSGTLQSISACAGPAVCDTALRAADSNSLQIMHWSLLTAPLHGIAYVTDSTTTIGAGHMLMPVGTSYLPDTGYTGTDTFSVRLSDGVDADTITIAVNVVCPILQTATTTITTNALHIAPNPTAGSFSVLLNTGLTQAATLSITDITGRQVYHTAIQTNTTANITTNLPDGLYILQANTAHGVVMAKLVVRK